MMTQDESESCCVSVEHGDSAYGEEDEEEEAAAAAKTLDRQLLQLLDSVDDILRLRGSLCQSLSQGWMEIASARYAMGPSRISQPLLSLKPCMASSTISVTSVLETDSMDLDGEECSFDGWEDHGVVTERPSLMHFTLEKYSSEEKKGKAYTELKHAIGKDTPTSSNLRHRSHVTDNGERAEGGGSVKISTPEIQDLKPVSEPLYWFGTLVSPHLRVAQSSFGKALETIVEIANAQLLAMNTKSQISEHKKRWEISKF